MTGGGPGREYNTARPHQSCGGRPVGPSADFGITAPKQI